MRYINSPIAKYLLKWTLLPTRCILLLLPFFMAFFKPAVSIGLGVLSGLALVRLFLSSEVQKQALEIFRSRKWIFAVYGFLQAWMFLSVFWSGASDSFSRAMSFNEMLLVPLILLVFHRDIRSFLNSIIKSLAAGCTLAGMITLYFVVFPDQVPVGEGYVFLLKKIPAEVDHLRFGAYSPFLDRLYYSYLTAALILVLIFRYLYLQEKSWMYYSLIIHLPVFFFLGGRGGQLAFVIAVILGLVFLWIRRNQWWNGFSASKLKWLSALSVAGLVGLFVLVSVSEKYSLRYNQLKWELQNYTSMDEADEEFQFQTVILRLTSWEHNLKLIRENPLIGVGIGDYRHAMGESYQREAVELPVHTNQQFLYFGVVGGLPLMIAFLVFFVGSFWNIFLHGQPIVRLSVLVWWSFMATVMLFDSPLNYQMPAFLFLSVWFFLYFQFDREGRGPQ